MCKKNSYDEFWLHFDMDNMGYIFEYCDDYCKEIVGIQIDKNIFLNTFIRSKLREVMETGHPQLLSESGYDTVKKFIDVDNNSDITKFATTNCVEAADMQYYWVGMMYAYLHYKADILSKDLIEIIPLQTMLQHYNLGHEVDISVYWEHVKHLFQSKT